MKTLPSCKSLVNVKELLAHPDLYNTNDVALDGLPYYCRACMYSRPCERREINNLDEDYVDDFIAHCEKYKIPHYPSLRTKDDLTQNKELGRTLPKVARVIVKDIEEDKGENKEKEVIKNKNTMKKRKTKEEEKQESKADEEEEEDEDDAPLSDKRKTRNSTRESKAKKSEEKKKSNNTKNKNKSKNKNNRKNKSEGDITTPKTNVALKNDNIKKNNSDNNNDSSGKEEPKKKKQKVDEHETVIVPDPTITRKKHEEKDENMEEVRAGDINNDIRIDENNNNKINASAENTTNIKESSPLKKDLKTMEEIKPGEEEHASKTSKSGEPRANPLYSLRSVQEALGTLDTSDTRRTIEPTGAPLLAVPGRSDLDVYDPMINKNIREIFGINGDLDIATALTQRVILSLGAMKAAAPELFPSIATPSTNTKSSSSHTKEPITHISSRSPSPSLTHAPSSTNTSTSTTTTTSPTPLQSKVFFEPDLMDFDTYGEDDTATEDNEVFPNEDIRSSGMFQRFWEKTGNAASHSESPSDNTPALSNSSHSTTPANNSLLPPTSNLLSPKNASGVVSPSYQNTPANSPPTSILSLPNKPSSSSGGVVSPSLHNARSPSTSNLLSPMNASALSAAGGVPASETTSSPLKKNQTISNNLRPGSAPPSSSISPPNPSSAPMEPLSSRIASPPTIPPRPSSQPTLPSILQDLLSGDNQQPSTNSIPLHHSVTSPQLYHTGAGRSNTIEKNDIILYPSPGSDRSSAESPPAMQKAPENTQIKINYINSSTWRKVQVASSVPNLSSLLRNTCIKCAELCHDKCSRCHAIFHANCYGWTPFPSHSNFRSSIYCPSCLVRCKDTCNLLSLDKMVVGEHAYLTWCQEKGILPLAITGLTSSSFIRGLLLWLASNRPTETVSRGILSESDLLRMLLPHWKYYVRNRKWKTKRQKNSAMKTLKKCMRDPSRLNSLHVNKFGEQFIESAALAFENYFNIATVVVSSWQNITQDSITKLKENSLIILYHWGTATNHHWDLFFTENAFLNTPPLKFKKLDVYLENEFNKWCMEQGVCDDCFRIARGAAFYKHYTKPTARRGFHHQHIQKEQKLWVMENIFLRTGEYAIHYECALAMQAGTSATLARYAKILRKSSVLDHVSQISKHSAKGAPSNNNPYVQVKKMFYKFVEEYRTLNGRQTGKRYFLLPRFHRITPDKKNPDAYVELSSSFQILLRHCQEQGYDIEHIPSCSTISKWFRNSFSHDTDIHPHKTDYCADCNDYARQIMKLNQQIKLQESHPENRKQLRTKRETVKSILELHEDIATKTDEDMKKEVRESQQKLKQLNYLRAKITYFKLLSYRESIGAPLRRKLRATYIALNFIFQLMATQYTHIICADFQKNRLIPYFGKDPQPGTTYYQKKMKIFSYGIVSPSNNRKQIYIIDYYNAAGDKDANLKLNLLLHFIANHIPWWVCRISIWMDNAGINKNSPLLNFLCGELTRLQRFLQVKCNFLIAGHTKFYPDILFAALILSLIRKNIWNQFVFARLMRRICSVHLVWASDIKDYVGLMKEKDEDAEKKYKSLYMRITNIKDNHLFSVYVKRTPFRHWGWNDNLEERIFKEVPKTMWLYGDGTTSTEYRLVAPCFPVLSAEAKLKIRTLRDLSGNMFIAPFYYMDNMVKLVDWKIPATSNLPRQQPLKYSRISLPKKYRDDFTSIYSHLSIQYHLPELCNKKVHDNVFTDFLPMEEYYLPPATSKIFPPMYRQHWRHKVNFLIDRNPHLTVSLRQEVHHQHLQSFFDSYPDLCTPSDKLGQRVEEPKELLTKFSDPIDFSFLSEIGWYLHNVKGDNPTPFVEGVSQLKKDSVIAISGTVGKSTRRVVWLARFVSYSPADTDILEVQYFHAVNSGKRKYTLEEELIEAHIETVICTGIPMQPKMVDNEIVWTVLLNKAVLDALQTDESMVASNSVVGRTYTLREYNGSQLWNRPETLMEYFGISPRTNPEKKNREEEYQDEDGSEESNSEAEDQEDNNSEEEGEEEDNSVSEPESDSTKD